MSVDISKGISHLEHLEDFVILSGSSGSNSAIDIISKFINQLEDQTENLEDQRNEVVSSVKVDGAPSLYFGRDNQGRFFVSTKSILSKEQKIGYSLADIQRLWKTGVRDVLINAWKALKPVYKENGIVLQGDLLWNSKSGKKLIEHDGQKFLTFQPNTILYAVPVDNKSELYRNVKAANLGVVVHGSYRANIENGYLNLTRLNDNNIRGIAEKLNQNRSVFVIDPFIDKVEPFEGSDDIIEEVKDLISSVESSSGNIDPEFNDEWVEGSNPMIKEAKKLLPIFINQQVRVSGESESIITAKDEESFLRTFRKKLKEFLTARSNLEQSKLKSSKGKERKAEHYKEIQKWFYDMDSTFEPMFRTFFRLFTLKNLILKIFDNVEDKLGKTFVVDKKNDYNLVATKPEGYVLLNGPNMVKIVDRAEFSRNNILYSQFREDKDIEYTRGTTGDSESIGDKKRIKVDSITDEIYEDILNSLDVAKNVSGFNELDSINLISKTKEWNVLWVGKMQPPTKAHIEVLKQLSKMFNKVLLLITDTGKFIDPELSLELINSAIKRKSINNIEVRIGKRSGNIDPLKSTFGISSKNKDTAKQSFEDIKRFFDLDEEESDRTFVFALGQEEAGKEGEEDRYNKIKNNNTMFIVNDGEDPSEDKPFGLYGIPIIRGDSGTKVGARQIRQMVQNGNIEEAKLSMAGGDDDIKDKVIDSMISKMNNQEEYFNIEGFNIDKEIINNISNDYYIEQTEAMDLILDILSGE